MIEPFCINTFHQDSNYLAFATLGTFQGSKCFGRWHMLPITNSSSTNQYLEAMEANSFYLDFDACSALLHCCQLGFQINWLCRTLLLDVIRYIEFEDEKTGYPAKHGTLVCYTGHLPRSIVSLERRCFILPLHKASTSNQGNVPW
jgi:hypothetical protein